MKTGVIVKFFDDKGFGFIQEEGASEDTNGIFVHVKAFANYDPENRDLIQPKVGDVVTYEIGEGREWKPNAINVNFVGTTSASSSDEDYSDEE